MELLLFLICGFFMAMYLIHWIATRKQKQIDELVKKGERFEMYMGDYKFYIDAQQMQFLEKMRAEGKIEESEEYLKRRLEEKIFRTNVVNRL